MLYTKVSFTVPATEGKQADSLRTCATQGHAFADRKGKCVRCGAKIRHTALEEAHER